MISDVSISFYPLTKNDLSLLYKWLLTTHVRTWWDTKVPWTMNLIQEKYETYIRGYKLVNHVKKPLYAYIIHCDNIPIGYIQTYNTHNFPHEPKFNLHKLPTSCAGLDFYIGEEAYLGKGLGSIILKKFLAQHVWPHYTSCLVNTEANNTAAIKTYEKAGFKSYATAGTTLFMIADRS